MIKILATIALSVAEVGRSLLTGGMPIHDGRCTLDRLEAEVVITRDDIGVPDIQAATLLDAVRAQGFVHAQERFFQMDLMRRYSSGSLAELIGRPMLSWDFERRPLRLERRAERIIESLSDDHRALLDAYAYGVNQGLDALETKPMEYVVLRQSPRPWTPADSILVGYVMFDTLSFGQTFERQRTTMREALPPELYTFLTPTRSRFDAPMGGNDYEPAAIPGPDVVDLRNSDDAVSWNDPFDIIEDVPAYGSNNLAISGDRTAHGGAILANDMHLALTVPNIWYRVTMHWADGLLAGVTLPGLPGIIAGANGHVAWGFTNVTGDYRDEIVVEVDPNEPRRYRAPDGWDRFRTRTETYAVRGERDVTREIRETRWGPVTDTDGRGRPLVLKWTALEPGGFDLGLFDLMRADTLEDALDIARRWNGPPQNVTIADDRGRIGWTISGTVPRRRGFDGTVSVSWADGHVRWNGFRSPDEKPMLIDPPDGVIYTANNRTRPGDQLEIIGDHFMSPERAMRLSQLLPRLHDADERDILQVILDTRSLPLDACRDIILDITSDAENGDLKRARELAEAWSGYASLDDRAFGLLTEFRNQLRASVAAPLLTPCFERDPGFRYNWPLQEEAVLRLIEERPPHLIPPPFDDWNAFLRDRLKRAVTIARLRNALDVPWGDVNASAVQHPLSRTVPQLSAVLDMPQARLPGHITTLRMQGWGLGASERLVVSPGRENEGICHMPAGQAGHPLMRTYRAGHDAWVHGWATPLLPGRISSTLTLTPPEH